MGDLDPRNTRVEELLLDNGDDLETPRPVEHWAYFPTEESRTRFITSLSIRFEAIHSFDNSVFPPNTYGVRFMHVGLPDAESMTRIIEMLQRHAAACGGAYDGWETQILESAGRQSAPKEDSV
jgi:hypothetical protein